MRDDDLGHTDSELGLNVVHSRINEPVFGRTYHVTIPFVFHWCIANKADRVVVIRGGTPQLARDERCFHLEVMQHTL